MLKGPDGVALPLIFQGAGKPQLFQLGNPALLSPIQDRLMQVEFSNAGHRVAALAQDPVKRNMVQRTAKIVVPCPAVLIILPQGQTGPGGHAQRRIGRRPSEGGSPVHERPDIGHPKRRRVSFRTGAGLGIGHPVSPVLVGEEKQYIRPVRRHRHSASGYSLHKRR